MLSSNLKRKPIEKMTKKTKKQKNNFRLNFNNEAHRHRASSNEEDAPDCFNERRCRTVLNLVI
jgi:hypothetical protein